MKLYEILEVIPAQTKVHINYEYKVSVEFITSKSAIEYFETYFEDIAMTVTDVYATAKDELYIRVVSNEPEDIPADELTIHT